MILLLSITQLFCKSIKSFDRHYRLVCNTEADLHPNEKNNTLTVSLHHQANQNSDNILTHLCEELNATETIFPGTDLRLIYKVGS